MGEQYFLDSATQRFFPVSLLKIQAMVFTIGKSSEADIVLRPLPHAEFIRDSLQNIKRLDYVSNRQALVGFDPNNIESLEESCFWIEPRGTNWTFLKQFPYRVMVKLEKNKRHFLKHQDALFFGNPEDFYGPLVWYEY